MGNYSNEKLRKIWNKGKPIPNYDSNIWRRDDNGHALKFQYYGKQIEYGWEVDHKHPIAKGGSDDIRNLRPLYWKTNRRKADN